MAYRILVSSRAQKEIEDAIDYYTLHSTDAPVHFIKALKDAYSILETAPFYRFRYKNVRALKLKKFPHSLYFIINKDRNIIRILSCFHNKRNPEKRPG